MYGCVRASMSGLTRSDTGARTPERGGGLREALELAARLDVEAPDTRFERKAKLFA